MGKRVFELHVSPFKETWLGLQQPPGSRPAVNIAINLFPEQTGHNILSEFYTATRRIGSLSTSPKLSRLIQFSFNDK